MKISSVSKKVLASALSAAMVVAFAPTVAFGGTTVVANTAYTSADNGQTIEVAYYDIDTAFAWAGKPSKITDKDHANGNLYTETAVTITLAEDVTVKTAFDKDAGETAANAVVVDLNGHTLTSKGAFTHDQLVVKGTGTIAGGDSTFSELVVAEGADVTIAGGTFAKIAVAEGASLTIAGGTFESFGTTRVIGAATDTANAGTITVKGGKFAVGITQVAAGQWVPAEGYAITATDVDDTTDGALYDADYRAFDQQGHAVKDNGDKSVEVYYTNQACTEKATNAPHDGGNTPLYFYTYNVVTAQSVSGTGAIGAGKSFDELLDTQQDNGKYPTEDQTITLSADASAVKGGAFRGTQAGTTASTIDGQGFKLSGAKVTLSGNVVVKNLTIAGNVEIANGAKVTFEDVDVTKDGSITVANAATTGESVFKSGEVKGDIAGVNNKEGLLTIKDGTFEGGVDNVTVKGGTFLKAAVTGSVVKGGTFKTATPATVANNFAAEKNADGTYTVKAGMNKNNVAVDADINGASVVVNTATNKEAATAVAGATTSLFASLLDTTGATSTTTVIDGTYAVQYELNDTADLLKAKVTATQVTPSKASGATAVQKALYAAGYTADYTGVNAAAGQTVAFETGVAIYKTDYTAGNKIANIKSMAESVSYKIDITELAKLSGAQELNNFGIAKIAKDGTVSSVASQVVAGEGAELGKTFVTFSANTFGDTYAVIYGSSYEDLANQVENMNKPAVEKATQGIDVAQKSKTVKLAGAKKTKKAVSFAMGASAETGLSIAKKSGSSRITVKGQKVTLKKGTKAGAYTAKVSIKAAASDEYLAAAKTITVKFVVKK